LLLDEFEVVLLCLFVCLFVSVGVGFMDGRTWSVHASFIGLLIFKNNKRKETKGERRKGRNHLKQSLPLHFTSLHFTSLHFTSLHFTITFTSP